MLVGDDVFIKGIRLGIEQDDYVYQSGDLLRGKGDPHAEIKVDEQSFIYTMSYAREHRIWPRPEPKTDTGVIGSGSRSPGGREVPRPGHDSPTSGRTPLTAKSTPVLEAEDVLKAALARLLEDARHNGIRSLATLRIRPFDKSDALKLMPLVKSIPNASKRVELTASFETASGSTAELSFKGDIEDAIALKDYLEPQFRAASDSDADISFALRFEPPLAVQGPSAEGLIQRLTRLVSPSAHVLATAAELD